MRFSHGGFAVGIFAFAAASCVTPKASAEAALSVELELAPCLANEAVGLARVVQAELGNSIAVTAAPDTDVPNAPGSNVARVRVSCAQSVIELEVQDPVTGKKLSRHLQIPPDLAAARARVLGLSIAELVAASWIELSGTRGSPVKAVEATAARETHAAALTVAKRELSTNGFGYELTGSAAVRHFPHDEFTSFGGAVAFAWLPRAWLDLVLDADATTGAHSVSLGRVSVFLGSIGLCPRLRRAFGRWSFDAGAGMRVGFAHFSGLASEQLTPVPEQRRATLPWAGPVLAFGASVRPVGPLALSAVLEGGLVSHRAEARVANRGEFEIAGPWFGLTLGLGFSELD